MRAPGVQLLGACREIFTAAKDESDLVEAISDCELARKQAGGLQWAAVLVELKL